MPKKDVWDNPDVQRYLARANKELVPMIRGSSITVALWHAEPDAKQAIELGFMVLFDKPIILLVSGDVPVPEKLRKIADAVIEGHPGDPRCVEELHEAMARLAGVPYEDPGES